MSSVMTTARSVNERFLGLTAQYMAAGMVRGPASIGVPIGAWVILSVLAASSGTSRGPPQDPHAPARRRRAPATVGGWQAYKLLS